MIKSHIKTPQHLDGRACRSTIGMGIVAYDSTINNISYILPKKQFNNFFKLLGKKFIMGGDYNAKDPQ